MTHLVFIFMHGTRYYVRGGIHYFAYKCSMIPVPFVRKTILFPFEFPGTSVPNKLTTCFFSIFGLLFYSIGL